MPQEPIYPGEGTSNSEQINYPINLLRSVAHELANKAHQGLIDHDSASRIVQNYLDTNPLTGKFLIEVLYPHQQNLRASYQWQLDLAQSILAATDLMEGTDTHVSQGFTS